MPAERSPGYGREFFEWSANLHAVSVNVNSPESHAATHFEKHKYRGFWNLAQIAVTQTFIEQPDQAVEVDMGEPVGQMDLVPVDSLEDIFYFQRPNRGTTWYPGVYCTPEDRPQTNTIVIITRSISRARVLRESPHPNLFGPELEGAPQADLYSAYPGIKTPGLPAGNPKYITEESIPFWQQYALAVDPYEKGVVIYTQDGRLGVPEAYKQV